MKIDVDWKPLQKRGCRSVILPLVFQPAITLVDRCIDMRPSILPITRSRLQISGIGDFFNAIKSGLSDFPEIISCKVIRGVYKTKLFEEIK